MEQTAKITNLLRDKQTQRRKGTIQRWKTKAVERYVYRKKKHLG